MTPLVVNAKNQTIRDILSNSIPLKRYHHILWEAAVRKEAGNDYRDGGLLGPAIQRRTNKRARVDTASVRGHPLSSAAGTDSMMRRVFTIFSALSLLLCIAATAFWVRSYWRKDAITLERWNQYTVESSPRMPDGRGGSS